MLTRILRALVRVLNGTPIMRWVRQARAWRDQIVDPQLAQVRRLVRDLRAGRVDVLYLGDSSSTFVGRTEPDRRRLPEMLSDELGTGTRVGHIAGPGYSPELHAEFVRILATMPERPGYVVLSTAVRTAMSLHVTQHPEYGHHRSIETLRKIPDAEARLRSVSLRNRRTAADFARFEAIEINSRWGRAGTVGEYLAQVRGRRGGPEDADRQRTLFDYFHGEPVSAEGHPQLRHMAEPGRRLREYGVPVVQYWPPVPVDQGERLFPGEFLDQVEANWAALQQALYDTLGPLLLEVLPPFDTPDDEFIDSTDGSKHWNQDGRLRVARKLAAVISRDSAPRS